MIVFADEGTLFLWYENVGIGQYEICSREEFAKSKRMICRIRSY